MLKVAVRVFVILTLVTNLVTFVWCQQHAIGRPLGPADLVRAEQKVCDASNVGPKCADCNYLLTCVGSFQVNKQTCSSINPKRPYCQNDACVASTSQLCPSSTFRCTSRGQFPDPLDCSRYYLCDGAGTNKAYAYVCPSNFVYDSKSGLCKRTTCLTIDCSKTPNKYVIFGGDPSILAYCLDNGSNKETILFRCPDTQSMQYDPNTLQCTYRCSIEGRFADRLDCRSFYECYREGGVLQAKHQKCPEGYSYDQVAGICIRQANCRNEIGDNGTEEDGESGMGPELLLFS
ncbi:unnamed protein product [Hermetia illucens]|uniref:Chitin-binding type-2 domain-containing protein n=1 Tax=Hermetia illucens TaxID=343691 RepID=A0A7R8UZY6_HERIL|nr:uncharacterized protein LOC119654447 [Hermetia illucens]CAD7089576.1 unnamed protein product [Hermetia illucens]